MNISTTSIQATLRGKLFHDAFTSHFNNFKNSTQINLYLVRQWKMFYENKFKRKKCHKLCVGYSQNCNKMFAVRGLTGKQRFIQILFTLLLFRYALKNYMLMMMLYVVNNFY